MNWLQKLFARRIILTVPSEVNLLVFHLKNAPSYSEAQKITQKIKQETVWHDDSHVKWIAISSFFFDHVDGFHVATDLKVEVKNEAGDSK